MFSRFQIFVRIGPFKRCSKAMLMTKNCAENVCRATQTRNTIFVLDLSLDTWPRMTPILNTFTEIFGWYLTVPQTRSSFFYWLISIYTVAGCDKTRRDSSSNFLLWPCLWRHRWPQGQQQWVSLDKFSKSIERLFYIVNRSGSSWDLREGAKEAPRPLSIVLWIETPLLGGI